MIEEYAQMPHATVSLETLLSTGKGTLLNLGGNEEDPLTTEEVRRQVIMQVASFLKKEMPKRFAHRVRELRNLPDILPDTNGIGKVREWYEQSFIEMIEIAKPRDEESEEAFWKTTTAIYNRHSDTLMTIASGLQEWRRARAKDTDIPLHEYDEIHKSLDAFILHRIGIRVLIGQYLELRKQQTSTPTNFVGILQEVLKDQCTECVLPRGSLGICAHSAFCLGVL